MHAGQLASAPVSNDPVPIAPGEPYFLQDGVGATPRTSLAKLRERVSVLDYGADPTGASDSTDAIHRAMTYLLDKFAGTASFYPAGPGDPEEGGATDYNRRDRRTGRIHFPAGLYRVQPEVFSSLQHPRAPYVSFAFEGEHRFSSVLLLNTGGSEAWFYRTAPGRERYQALSFRNLGFTTDDYRHGSFAKVYSSGAAKQLLVESCQFTNLQTYMHTVGDANADLMRTVFSTIEHYGSMLILDNSQSVQHDFIGTHFRSWGSQVEIKQHGGGNVAIKNGSIDLIWDERMSPATGNFLLSHDADARIGEGNCTYKWEDCRIEMEAYALRPGPPPFGIVRTVENPVAFPRVILENVNFVNGRTYPINRTGKIIGPGAFRRIAAMRIWPGKHVEIRSGVLLKTFFYLFEGSRDTGSPNHGGVVRISNAYDGVNDELPSGDAALENIHRRSSYSGSAGRLITQGMTDHTGGSSFVRKVIDADPRWRHGFAHDPASTVKTVHFKPTDNGLPLGSDNRNDHYLDLPPGILALRLFVRKAAGGNDPSSYQLHLKVDDRAGRTIGSSRPSRFMDEHLIDLDHVDLSGVARVCLCAAGGWSGFERGGIAYIQYV